MQLTRIKLTGFKSFVEPTELKIEPGLTGIVGPNGCGKSNLLEAIRWVMGEGSAKSLRGGAMDDVIFAGTASRPARSFAEVSLLAEGISAANAETEVVRRIDVGAGSGYRINGDDVRAKDVALLFADAATGAHSPALVSQGRIGEIISAKPVDRRVLLEEAAGISGLHVRRKEAEQRLRATTANLERLDLILGEMESRVASLKRQARSAEKYRALSGQIRTAEGRMIYARWRTAAAAADVAKAEVDRLNDRVVTLSQEQEAARGGQALAVAALSTARSQIQAERDAASDTAHQLATLRAERDQLKRRVVEIAAQAERLSADRAREGQLADDAARALDALAREIEKLEALLAVAVPGQEALEARLADAERQGREAEVALAQALAEQARIDAEARVSEAAFQMAQTRLSRAAHDVETISAQIAQLGDDAAPQHTRDDAGKARKTAEARIGELDARLARADSDATNLLAARDAKHAEVAGIAAEHASLLREAEAIRAATAAVVGGEKIIDNVVAQPGYERALAAALGDDLDASLTRGARRHWQGSISHADDPALPGGGAALLAYVSAPSELSRRLGQVLVVAQDEGQKLAVGQRLVTLEGALRRWDGYVAQQPGNMAAERLIRVNRLSDIDRQLGPLTEALSYARSALANLGAQIAEERTRSDEDRRERDTCQAQLRAAQRDEDQAAMLIERLTARRVELAERLQVAKAERNQAEQEFADAQRARAPRDPVQPMQAAVAKLSGIADAMRAEIADLRGQLAASVRQREGQAARLAAAKVEAADWQARAGSAQARIEEMSRRARLAEEEALAIAASPGNFDAQISTTEAKQSALAAALDAARTSEIAAERALSDIEADLAARAEQIAQVREQRAAAQARAENEELRRIEMGRVSGERFACPPPLLPRSAGFADEDVGEASAESAAHERLSAERERLGPVNLIAEEELTALEAERSASAAERDELSEAVNRLRGSIGSLNREGRTRLLEAFEAVDGHFQRLFARLFGGGAARLELIDADDPLLAGLEIFAQPPGKKLTSLSLLSGGEQALTATALIFGLFLTNPAPICVLDEVDAPLDDANVERFCDLLDAMVRETRTRYLIVTHNAVTMSRMHRLFGVTMIEQGVSRLVSVDLSQAERLVA